MKTREEQRAHLSAAIDVCAVVDAFIDRQAILDFLIDAVLLPLVDQPFEVRRQIPGTDEYRLWRTSSAKMTADETQRMETWVAQSGLPDAKDPL